MFRNKLIITHLLFLLCLVGNAQTGFIENRGQFHPNVLYEADFQDSKIFLDREGFTVLLHDEATWRQIIESYHHPEQGRNKVANSEFKLGFQAIKYRFEGADLSRHSGLQTSPEHYNYFIGNDQNYWATGVKKHFKVLFTDIYPHIDLEFEAIDRRFKYNFILKPGANIRDIKIDIEGADKLKVQDENLLIYTRFGSFSEIMPLSYTLSSGGEIKIMAMRYTYTDERVGFSGSSGNTQTLIIDPELVFSTYAGNTVDNFGFTATYDKHGNLYAGGIATGPSFTIPDGRYPATPGAFDVTYNGGSGNEPANIPCDISLSKYDSTGSTLLFATYLGGFSDEYPHSLIVDEHDQLIVFGTSYSNNFPYTTSAPQSSRRGGSDIVVTKFSADGSSLIGSTYLGGSENDGLNLANATKYFYADDFRGEVNLDALGNIYVATTTASSNFPVSSGAFQTNYGGRQDGVIFCLSPDIDILRWSSYFGGSGDDAIYSIDVAENGNLYISGGTNSSNLQKTGGSLGPVFNQGRADGFVALINPDGKELIRTAYWGGNRYDQILSLEIDRYGNIFVVGQSEGGIPVQGDVYSNPGSGQFISKFNDELTTVLLSTVYGSGRGTPDITVNAFLVDECGKIFVSGWGGSLYMGPTAKLTNMPRTDDELQETTDGNDFHIIVLRRDAKELLYGTYFGGKETDDHVDGGTSRFDKKGVIYQSVCSSCPGQGQSGPINDFPTTDGAYAEENQSPRCSNASFKIAFGNLNRQPQLQEEIYHVTALDTLLFSYKITDPDEDTIRATVQYPAGLKDYFINPQTYFEELTELDLNFAFAPQCMHVGDTFVFPVHAQDVGCPEIRDSNSLFRVVVQAPPVLPPPGVLCLNFLAKDALRIEWDPSPPSKYFYCMYLYKVSPDGASRIIDTIYHQNAGTYTDADVSDPRNLNYTYYLVTENLCKVIGPKSYDLSSVKESEVPVEASYLRTVTVEDPKIRVEWLRSNEDDFGHYEIYKGKRGDTELQYLSSVYNRDSLFLYDDAVNVDNTSYCYEVRVSDDCGHLSIFSNKGCSIVIRGESLPFKFDLNWDEYMEWAGAVDEYQLLRSVDTGYLQPLVLLNHDQRTYIDGDLDYDWGGYWYSVVAYEGPGSENASSRSNNIYLIQPPLLHVPNAFTANHDNLNDVFGWSDVFVRNFKMSIYNCWGEKVFETTDKNATWDGIYMKNGLKNSNVYIWIAEYNGWDRSRHMQKGTVTIMR